MDEDLLDPLLDPETHARWLDPGAIGRVEGRLRGVGHPPAHGRRDGRDAPTPRRPRPERAGRADARVPRGAARRRAGPSRSSWPARPSPSRWIGAEEAELYATAFDGRRGPTRSALETIVHRFLQTHALIGLDDLTARYPIDPARATDLLERWSESGRAIRLDPAEEADAPRWADRQNLDEVRRLSIALRRRESVAVRPEVFADFVARRQHVHPETRREGAAAVALVLEQLHGFAAPADLWESDLLPRRVRDYRPAWLDEALSAGGWLWRAEGDGRGAPRVAFAPRDFAGAWPAPEEADDAPPADPRSRRRSSITWPVAGRASPPTWPARSAWSRRGPARRCGGCCVAGS